MSARARTVLFFSLFTLSAIGVSSAYGACPTPKPCYPAAFTGSVHAQLALCEKQTRGCQGRRGPAGPRGLKGKRGATGAVGIQGIQGIAGVAGAAGSDGEVGATGAVGIPGATGLQGATGATGLTGLMGLSGQDGATGAVGDTGETGPVGPEGPAGPQGPTGATGTPGSDGDDGATGATGAAGADATNGTYAYVYNSSPQTVAIGSDVTFDSNGPIGPGILHAPGDAQVAFTEAGIYEINFSVSGTEPNQMAIYLNGVPANGSTYGSGAGTQQNTGQLILVVSAGDVITLVNHTSSAAVGLATPIGGTSASVNASLLITQLD